MVRHGRHTVGDDLLRLYLDDIGRHPLLTKQDEVVLAQQIEQGRAARAQLDAGITGDATDATELERVVDEGERASRAFVNANLRLVVSIARKFPSSDRTVLDLIQDGNLGLMHAVEKFDWRKGFKFSTYATWWIRQAIHRGIADSSRTVRLPAGVHDRSRQIARARDRLQGELHREPTDAEVAAELGIKAADVAIMTRSSIPPASLSSPIFRDSSRQLGDTIPDEYAADPAERAVVVGFTRDVDRLLDILNERERAVITLRFGLTGDGPCAPAEAARQLAMSSHTLRQIERRAMAKLRHPSVGYAVDELLTG